MMLLASEYVLHISCCSNHTFQFHHCQCGGDERSRQAGGACEFVDVARLVAQVFEQGTLFVVFRQHSLSLGLLRYHEEVESFQDIVDAGYRLRSFLNQFVDASAALREDATGESEDLAALIERRISSDKGTTLVWCFCHKDTERER